MQQKKQINSLLITDSLRKQQQVIYINQINAQDEQINSLQKQINKKDKSLTVWKIGGITLSLGLLVWLIVK